MIRILVAALLALVAQPSLAASGHAHNDYEHARPLLDAIEQGFTSVEADVWLRDGKLLIGHDAGDLEASRTLEALYLDPLRGLIETNGGSVHGDGEPFMLLIDIKSDAEATYAALSEALAGHSTSFEHFVDGSINPGPIIAVVSGNRALSSMAAETTRYAFYDGRLSDLENGPPPVLMPLISDNWTRHFSWTGAGPMPGNERMKLERIVASAHARGYALRFWATPDRPGAERNALWQALVDAGVDYINTDDLAGLADFLSASLTKQ